MYKPLPDCLTIKESKINGLGLFAAEDIEAGEYLGISHHHGRNGMERTPLGGFYNHSNDPNCIKGQVRCKDGWNYRLFTLKDVKAGEEITVKYTLYNIEKKD